ncbi:MAG: thioredoxin family protein [Deltaproteobacteria bacterium]|nr:thioredoxin family protein [Deltaproteobacteria bacterium]
MPDPSQAPLPDGLVVFLKRDCPTCEFVIPVLKELAARPGLTLFTQDDPTFPEGMGAEDETDLARSWHHAIEAVPTLLRIENGKEAARALGWHRGDWEELAGVSGLGAGLPDWRPGCGSLSVDPTREPELRLRFEGGVLRSRRVELAALEDEQEAIFERGWTDGLPVVPPTEARVMAMLEGTTRAPDEVVATVPPSLVEVTVEKIAINAVMAGCKPEYLPIVFAAVEAVCTDEFNMHGVQATTMGCVPLVVVNGPIRRAVGMNSGVAVLSPGNRANSTIGRALQLVIRNIGGSRPGEIDRSTFGHPGKLGMCFAEDEEASPWEPFSTDFGVAAGTNTVTVFACEGPRLIVDQLSREPDSLVRSMAACLKAVHHPKLGVALSALLVIGPEHGRVFREAGWSKAKLKQELAEALVLRGGDVMRGAGGIAEGLPLPPGTEEVQLPKFRPEAFHIVFAGSGAGLFSTIFGGWLTGPEGSQAVTQEITP